ncbi:MAG: type II secretion system F family protein, partial [Mycobacteriales bacterium]
GLGLIAVISVVTLSVNLLAAAALIVVGIAAGVLMRDWWLTRQVRRREQAMMEEFPVVAELLALAVTAGESPVAALQRVCRLCRGELSVELGRALAEARAGASLIGSLQAIGVRTSLDPLARFVDGMVIALERGTPLAEVLRAQACDVREAGKRELLASGGRREIAMMFPVVFLLLPITVFFALYPGLQSISDLTRG